MGVDVYYLTARADVAATKSGPATAGTGQPITYTLTIRNVGSVTAQNVVVTDTLPAEAGYISDTAPVTVTQTGAYLVWDLGALPGNGEITFDIVGQIAETATPGESLVNTVEATTETEEGNLANNVYTATTTVVGADLRVSKSGPATGIAGYPVTYTISLANQGRAAAASVVLTDTLPQYVDYLTYTAPFPLTPPSQGGAGGGFPPPSQGGAGGGSLVWQVGDLAVGQTVDVQVVGIVSDTASLGSALVNRAEAAAATAEENPSDNVATASTLVQPGYRFSAWLDPANVAASLGARATTRVEVHNTGTLADEFSLALSGLNPAWYTLEPRTLALPPGATGEARVTFLVTDCLAAGTYSFDVDVHSPLSGGSWEGDGQLELQSAPTVAGLTPPNGTQVGSRDVLFAWTTGVSATTSVFIRQEGVTTTAAYTGAGGTSHSVVITGLERNTGYRWTARSASECGVAESGERRLSIGNGLVFTRRSYDFTIDRDYDQRVSLAVHNQDAISHTLLLTVEVPTEHLIVGFVGSGSVDQVITLQPGETRDVTLAIHAQDAQPNGEYDLVAHLIADEEGDEPILDYAAIHVTVFVPVIDFTLEQIAYDPTTLVRTFRITNHSNVALTDLGLDYEVVSGTGALLVAPSLNHARLGTGGSLEFSVIPVLDETFEGLTAQLVASAAGEERTAVFDVACQAGCQVREGRAENVMLEARNGDWYCTNRPIVTTQIDLPGGFRRANVASAELRVTITSMWTSVRPHDADFYLNGHWIGGYYDVIPDGVYVFPVDPAYLNETATGVSRNTVTIVTTHMNGGHYVVSTDIALSICLTGYSEWVCAADQTQADEIVSGRSYLIPAADAITTHILEPQDGERFLVGSAIQVGVTVTDSLASGRVYAVIGSADNENGGLMLYDDGRHGDGAAGDGLYANIWTPLHPGPTTLTVEAGNCEIVGSDSITVDVVTAESRVNLAHSVPLSGVAVLSATFSHPPLTHTIGADDVTYDWTYVLSPTERTRVTTFDLALAGIRPGEVRQVASGTVVSYTTGGGHGIATLPPLYVSAAHLIAIAPPTRTSNPGGMAVYEATLYNPQATDDVFTLTLDGLPTGWAGEPFTVPIGAGAQVGVPVTVSIPPRRGDGRGVMGDYPFAATVETTSGGQDSAQAQVTVADWLEVAIAPSLLSAGNGETVTYTLTVTNLETVSRTYALNVDGLGRNEADLPATLGVEPGASATTTLRVTALAPRGLYSIQVCAACGNLQTCALANLLILSELGVAAGLDPTVATGGRGSPAAYTLTVTNTGSLPDTYDLAVDLPEGWSADLSANGSPLSSLSLSPYVFNAASLQLAVIPATDTVAGSYPFTVTATSRADPGTFATTVGATLVSQRGVTVQISPQSTTMHPTGSHTWDVLVANTGAGMDTFDLMPGGIISITAQFSANPVTLGAGGSTVVQLTAGPLEFVLPQTYPIAVTAVSQGDPDVFGYDTAEVTFEGFEDVEVALLPSSLTVTDTLEASYLVVITNTGNVDTIYTLDASSDPALQFDLEVDQVYIPPHMTAGVLLTAKADTATGGTCTITVQADSATTGSAASDTTVGELTIVITNKPPQVDAGADQTVDEGDEVSFSGSFTDPNPEDTHTIAWDFGDDSSPLVGGTEGGLTPTHVYADDGVYTVTLTVTDDDGAVGSDTLLVTVANVAPTVGEITAPVDPFQVNTEVNASAAFTDPGAADTHTPVWEWGDGNTSPGIVEEMGGSGTVSGSHTYTAAGVYTIRLTVADDDGDSGESIFQYIVVCDAEGGFVTGGGWFHSPEGDYTEDPSLRGKANFGFVSKYKQGASVPTGETEFQLKGADFNFHSETYKWLVVSTARAWYKGTGTVNGEGGYEFLITAVDADANDDDDIEVDRFRIKIWFEDEDGTRHVVYDNGLGADDFPGDPTVGTTELGGGSIVIHQK